MSTHYTLDQVAAHNKEGDAWVVVDGKVFDVTKFLSQHPGGKKVLLMESGKDATEKFRMFHKPTVLQQYEKLQIGVIADEVQDNPAEKKKSKKHEFALKDPASGPYSQKFVASTFGEGIPYGDPNWYSSWYTYHFNESHLRFRSACRAHLEKFIVPFAHEWDEKKELPKDLFQKVYQAGFLPAVVGGPWPTQYAGDHIAGGVKPEQWDIFHEYILLDEVSRAGSGGIGWGLCAGLAIGLPPVLRFGSEDLKNRVCGPCLRGEKVICLAITEPSGGSDVANLSTSAKLSEDGKYYIVNGEKKWITNGVYADFFTVAVRTGGKGMGGVSMLLIERGDPGLKTRQMQCSGVWPSGTTYITFEDVKVPVQNLIGKENQGFKYIMYNFNHERWMIAVQAIRFSRVCLEESIKYSFKRRTFGKLLVEHPVIRLKLAHMAAKVESAQAWLTEITAQMKAMDHKEADRKLSGSIALIKAHSSQVFEFCAREASQIFGGLAYTRGGQGEKVERLYREVRAYAIPGGSEEIMFDLGVRMAIKEALPMLMNAKM